MTPEDRAWRRLLLLYWTTVVALVLAVASLVLFLVKKF